MNRLEMLSGSGIMKHAQRISGMLSESGNPQRKGAISTNPRTTKKTTRWPYSPPLSTRRSSHLVYLEPAAGPLHRSSLSRQSKSLGAANRSRLGAGKGQPQAVCCAVGLQDEYLSEPWTPSACSLKHVVTVK